ncbi:uncharacterized protein LAESUDRAFT_725544 [Laetiporus sulphureus 93-53]|uniref:C3H1-type domain-containing protein n=1 Tax=Laetiporus sulphureus 93-53 TaxID=1314785 RepID=A0A165ED80_9APHY|nr:uncharacterized protein LAESUDRAFT_725544 [Laetiporus sulphureus 93-53]KZT06782.1 hypothetical protein LAESUDRAFT_725544 [Laetiporus sulphureus 93-53]
MLFDPETSSDLKTWLVKNLEPICDAEPGALAEYILALLKHNAPESELRKELSGQLEEFLEKENTPFLDTLFTALRTKSYMPYSAASPTGYPSSNGEDNGIPIPLDALLTSSISTSPSRGLKRSLDHEDHDSHAPAKGPRTNDGHFSRYGRNDRRSSWGDRGDRGARMGGAGRGDYMDGGMGRGPSGHGRGICRDYYNHGYCARGAFCKYSHGDDAVVPSQLFPMAGPMGVGPLPFVPMLPGAMPFGISGGSNAAYDPRERMDMRPVQGAGLDVGDRPINARAPMVPRERGAGSPTAPNLGELPAMQDLTGDMGGASGGDMNGSSGMMAMQGIEMTGAPALPNGHGRGGYRGGRGGGGRGVFGGEVQNFRPDRHTDKTLVVEKIPQDKLSLGAVNEWFKRFGNVTNVAVDAANGKALVSFSSHAEAHTAWRSKDAVFDNRFVKVYWHKPMEGHGQLGARMLAASAPLMANIAARETAPTTISPESSTTQPAPSTPTPIRKSSTPSAAAALAAKQRLLEQQIAEQKSLMAKLGTASSQEKKEIMARLRKLGEEMKPLATPSPATPPASAATAKSRGITPSADEKERLERERLDKELELHHAVSAAEGEMEENTEELKATLAKLKAEAASLGITDVSDGAYSSGTTYRPYRARGRGRGMRGGYRGFMRGGPPRGSMKLDLRPKTLLVKNVGAGAEQAVREWYETMGQVESVDTTDDGDVLVAFRSRAAAEQGLAKGTNIPSIGQVRISWHNNQQTGAAAQKTSLQLPEGSSPVEDRMVTEDRPPSPAETDEAQYQEESAPAWAGDDADGFRML